MGNYAILRMEKRKLGAVTGICNHHERLKEQYKSNPDIDPERTHLNYHIHQPKDKYRPLVLKRIKEAGTKRRSNSVVLQDCLATASPDWINELPYEKQQEFFNHAYQYFVKTFGEQNILSAVVHMDEANPHMHICFVPITKDNRLSSKDLIGGPQGLVKHQDNYYAHMVEKFPDLNRGIPSKVTHRKHIPNHFYKSANVLYEHYEEIVAAISDIGLISNAKKKDEAISIIGKYAPEMAAMKSQLKMTDKHIDDLEKALQTMHRCNDDKNDVICEQKQEISDLKDKVAELNYKQRMLQRQFNRIPPEILEQLKRDEQRRRKEEREGR